MAGSSAFDGGRFLRAGAIAFGALIWAAPVLAQSQDPLAALPTSPTPIPPPPTSAPPSPNPPSDQTVPAAAQPAPAPLPAVAVPKDWRGVFDAIDAGNWASAQAG